jgi:hypothetical protein
MGTQLPVTILATVEKWRCRFLDVAVTHSVVVGGPRDQARGRPVYGADRELSAREEADALARLLGRRVAEAVVADGLHRAREDVAQVAGDELFSGDSRGTLGVSPGAVFPA